MEAVLGIDIGKATFSACLLKGTQTHSCDFANMRTGFGQLKRWLGALDVGDVRACMESTNRYWEPLAIFLHQRGHRVSVVNAYRTSAYWKSEHLRAKTDRIDAAVIARFCQSQNPRVWVPPSALERELRACARELDFLKAERRRFRTRMEHGNGYALRRIVSTLSNEIRRLERHLLKTLRADAQLAHAFRNVQTIPGIGKVTAYTMLTEIGSKVQHLDRDELVSYAGLAPRIFESGTSIRKSKGTNKAGNSRVKRAFYLPALAAARTSPQWKALYHRLVGRGKPRKVALGAIMRKLFVAACGVLRSGKPYDPALIAATA